MRKIVRRPLRPGVSATAPEPQHAADQDAEADPKAEDDPQPQPAELPRAQGAKPDWADGDLVLPRTKRLISLRIDADVLDYFQRGGKGYQTRMNAVLRAFMEARSRRQD